jgi:putative endonuclease
MNSWFVYILKCTDGSLYTGITTDVERRLAEHQAGTASKYTAAYGADKIVYTEKATDRSGASKREAEIKQLTRKQKQSLLG